MRTILALAFVATASGALAADVSGINPYAHFNQSRDQLAATYPYLTQAELDRLLFRIADAQSVQMLNDAQVKFAAAD
jgi:hypothetical protein